MLGRAVALALALATVPAAAAPVPEPSFPAAGDRFLLSVRGLDAAGHERFARLYAAPDRKDPRYWTTTMVCGTVDTKTGRERILMQGGGDRIPRRGKADWDVVARRRRRVRCRPDAGVERRQPGRPRRDGLDVGPVPRPRERRAFVWRLIGACLAIPPPGGAMFDREFFAALGLCALGLTVAGVAAARPTPSIVTVSQAGAPMVTVFATETQRPGFTGETGPRR